MKNLAAVLEVLMSLGKNWSCRLWCVKIAACRFLVSSATCHFVSWILTVLICRFFESVMCVVKGHFGYVDVVLYTECRFC